MGWDEGFKECNWGFGLWRLGTKKSGDWDAGKGTSSKPAKRGSAGLDLLEMDMLGMTMLEPWHMETADLMLTGGRPPWAKAQDEADDGWATATTAEVKNDHLARAS